MLRGTEIETQQRQKCSSFIGESFHRDCLNILLSRKSNDLIFDYFTIPFIQMQNIKGHFVIINSALKILFLIKFYKVLYLD